MKLKNVPQPTHDYLKYYGVIIHYYKVKYKLSNADLQMLLFLRSEGYFTYDKFDEFDNILSWDMLRFNRLVNEGWINKVSKRFGYAKGIYVISYKAKRMIAAMYKKLAGEDIPTSAKNPMFKRKVGFSDKVYRMMIMRMKADIRAMKDGVDVEWEEEND